MLNIIYIFQDIEPNDTVKLLLSRVCDLVSEHLVLPKEIQIEFKKLSDSNYAETSLNPRYKNRITINSNLELTEMINPLIHELIHLSQLHEGKLRKRRDGMYIWENRNYTVVETLSYKQYLELPWEADVVNRQKQITKQILDKLGKL